MRNHQIINQKRFASVFLSVCMCASLCSCTAQKDTQATAVIAPPVITSDKSLPGESKTTWDCVCFGSYPMSELVDGDFSAVDDYALREGDMIRDPDLYAKLTNAGWNNNECELDGNKYRRVKAPETLIAREQHYQWDGKSYHYFKYEPIKWRVLEKDDHSAMLVADRLLDCEPFNTKAENVYWETCSLRSFLNDEKNGFYANAFSETEKKSVLPSVNENPDNSYYGTKCGDAVADKVFILSSDEVFASPAAARHGFCAGGGVDDPARRFRPTMYAKARGTWYSPVDDYRGNGFWFMRTAGYSLSNITYICDFGYIYNRGTDVTCNDSGILPAIRIDLSKAGVKAAGTVTNAN